MQCEIVAIGTELLLGQIIDTNSSWIGEQLALVGIDCKLQTKVGDNIDRMVDAIGAALERADVVICCGGLGPTQDDLTREALARLSGSPLVFDADRAELVRERFGPRGRSMPDINLLQAYRPESGSFLATQPGTAPGLRCPVGDRLVFAVPGVPWEMQAMVQGDILPELMARAGLAAVIRSRTLRLWGHSESGVAEVLADRIAALDESGNPTLAFLASGIEGLKVRITAKASSEAEAEGLLAAEERQVRQLLGEHIFGVDDESMEHAVLAVLRDQNLKLAVAESLTGGLLGARITGVPGASAHFLGGIVAYDSEVKFEQLGVPRGPVVSEAAAAAMASGVRTKFGADVAISLTGVAGPTEQDGHRPGTLFIGTDVGGVVEVREIWLPGHRKQVRELSVISSLWALRQRLLAAV